jgi:hypothetical protein
MDLTRLMWIKNVNHQDKDKFWAYNDPDAMEIREDKSFKLHWLNSKGNAKGPCKGDLMVLIQRTKISHIVEFLDNPDNSDNSDYENQPDKWYRIVKVVWMPPKGFDWNKLCDQEKIFGFKHIVCDGAAHSLAAKDKMPQFQKHWEPLGSLPAFQKHLSDELAKIAGEPTNPG